MFPQNLIDWLKVLPNFMMLHVQIKINIHSQVSYICKTKMPRSAMHSDTSTEIHTAML